MSRRRRASGGSNLLATAVEWLEMFIVRPAPDTVVV